MFTVEDRERECFCDFRTMADGTENRNGFASNDPLFLNFMAFYLAICGSKTGKQYTVDKALRVCGLIEKNMEDR